MITEEQFKKSAAILGLEVAALKAVAEVESGGSGFLLSTSEPVILFEPHIFWKELKKVDIDPYTLAKEAMTVRVSGKKAVIPVDDANDPTLYPIWVPGIYGPSSDQHRRLQKAVLIHRDAALKSCSWGKFQILGQNYKMCAFTSIQEFVNSMYKSEDAHLDAFVRYILSAGLDDELRFKQWASFARSYNGPLYWKNKYDTKLAAAFKRYQGK